jgi:ubiquinone/menaquinone biosynthesis C-methylase UbiE
MTNEQVFNNRAENYAKGRLGYADGILELIFHDILKANSKIADVGSGTGIFAKEFIERGFDVYCVEPNEQMRAQAERIFAGNPHFISVAAYAENTTLPDHSVDLVTAASSFHWFDADKFHTECKRILKPNGIFFAVKNNCDYSDPFTRRQEEICRSLCSDFTAIRQRSGETVPKLQRLFGSSINHRAFDFPLKYTKETFIQRSLSSSYAPEQNTAAYQKYIDELWALMDEFAPGGDKITVPNSSVAYWGKLS